jgi:hypothetical protein
MHIRVNKTKQLLVLGILILLVITFSGCIGSDNGDDDGDGNGNGNGNGGNGNGGNGNNNTTNDDKVISVQETHYDPHPVNIGTPVIFWATLNSTNPLSLIQIVICIDTICLAADDMIVINAETKEFNYQWTIPPETSPDAKVKYTIVAKDSLGNSFESDDYFLELV